MKIADSFPRYTEYDPQIPCWIVTPEHGGCLSRFFDTPPFSPSGRYLAAFRLLDETKVNKPGDVGQIVLVDLAAGTEKIVAETRGWEAQMGANLQWGGDDETLLFNDVDTATWTPHGVILNPHTGEQRTFPGGLYRASYDGRYAFSGSLECMRRTQEGYGVVLPDDKVRKNQGFPADDGLYRVDLKTGERKLLLPLAHILEEMGDRLEIENPAAGQAYIFHSKTNRQDSKVLFTIRWIGPDAERDFSAMKWVHFNVLTANLDGSDLQVAVPASQWVKGGHHINWHPDGEHLTMNLAIEGHMKFTQVRYNGENLHSLFDEPIGSGHPTIHKDGRYLLTDTYLHEPDAYGDGTVPLRWIDLETREEQRPLRFCTDHRTVADTGTLRVDPHPAWDLTDRYVAFNAFLNQTRRVLVADFGPLLGR